MEAAPASAAVAVHAALVEAAASEGGGGEGGGGADEPAAVEADDKEAALAALVAEVERMSVGSAAALEAYASRATIDEAYGTEFLLSLRRPDELVAEALLRNAAGDGDGALCCACAATRIHDGAGTCCPEFRFGAYDRRDAIRMMAVFLAEERSGGDPRWEALARVASALGSGTPYVTAPVASPRLDVLGGGDGDLDRLPRFRGGVDWASLALAAAVVGDEGWTGADLPRLVVVECAAAGTAVTVEFVDARTNAAGARVVCCLYSATGRRDFGERVYSGAAEAAKQLAGAAGARQHWPPRTVQAPAALVRRLGATLAANRARLTTAACVRARAAFAARNPPAPGSGQGQGEKAALAALRDGVFASFLGVAEPSAVAVSAADRAAGNAAFAAGDLEAALVSWDAALAALDGSRAAEDTAATVSLHANKAEAHLRLRRYEAGPETGNFNVPPTRV